MLQELIDRCVDIRAIFELWSHSNEEHRFLLNLKNFLQDQKVIS